MYSRKIRVRRKRSLIRDQRGAVAFEMLFVFTSLMIGILVPFADLAVACYQYATAWDALRAFGQSIQYSPPPDVTSTSTWASTAIAKADSRYPIQSFQVMCGTAVCSSTNTVSPKFYSYSTTVTLNPMVLRSVLCNSGNGNTCAFTLPYTERFQ
ncbi:Flp pilus assembly protein TadG [Bradyrhizobium sp. USDA 3240]